MKAIVNNEDLAELLMSDPISSGTKVTLEFLYGMLNPSIEIEANDYQKCPVLKLLQGAGHFSIEEKGLKQLEEYCVVFMNKERGSQYYV